ncbi:MAG: hypothetical protein JXA78_10560 [Anaerolineales bacterium]|nr:hypothetical protein [Anaerolineales bacterium]
MVSKAAFKHVLGELPLTAEVYWRLRQHGRPLTKAFSLRKIEKRLPEWCTQAQAAARKRPPGSPPPKRVMVFSTLRYWIEYGTLLSLALSGLGHQVTFIYLPFASNWYRAISRFDLRRQNAYAQSILSKAAPLLRPVSLLDIQPIPERALQSELLEAIREVSLRDTQYTLQLEEVDHSGSSASAQLYQLRLERNLYAAGAALAWIESLKPEQRPNVLLTPNGSVLEMGAIFQAVRSLGIPAVTYEFGEQRGRIWLAYNSEVMLQETEALWKTHKERPLTGEQWEQVRALYASRQNASLWENFSRLWQGQPSQGGQKARQELGLDSRPVILLAANVIGDSLTLGRQVFSQNMTEWLRRSVQFFAGRPDVQLVVRIHPGERYISGPSVAQVVQQALPEIPAHIHLVQALDPVNTYDLIEIADLGLVYTTTTGMEMAMSGVPVIVAGKTHYRGKGFTLDPVSWDSYRLILERSLSNPQDTRLSREQVERAWSYAYRFFFDYPCPFPWHLLDFWDKLDSWPIERALSEEGQALFGDTYRYLAGEPRNWAAQPSAPREAV